MKKRIALFLTCFLMASLAIAQTKVTGTVISVEDGEPIPGATVLIEGTKTGVMTDANGNFAITVPASAKRLEVSCTGMIKQLVRIKPVINVELQVDNKALDEVLVVAYGTATRSSFTGSASVVGAEQIENQVATNVTAALAGTTPGVQYIASNGDPASNGPTIRIRGISSINAGNAPLYVLDGVPYDGAINAINPQDVESMTVLKDASAAAIYGARGANGVILINTKKGKRASRPEVKFDAKWGSNSRLVPNYDVVTNPGQYYEEVFKHLYNTNITSGYDAAYAYQNASARLYDRLNGGVGYQVFTLPEGQNLIGTNLKLNPNATLGYSDGTYTYYPDNWYDEAFFNSFRQEYNFSVSGTSDRISVYAGGGFLQDGGIVKNSGFKRYNGRLNADYRATDWLTLNANMNYTHTDSDQPSYGSTWGSSGNMFYLCNTIAPIYPLYVRDANGNIMYNSGRIVYDANQTNFQRASGTGNAVRDNEFNKDKTYRDQFTGDWGLTINPFKGMTIKGDLGVTASNSRNNYLGSVFGGGSSSDGYTSVSHGRTFSINTQLIGEYKTNFNNSQHNLDIMVGYEQYKYKYQYLYGYNTHLYDPYIGELNNAKHTTDRENSSYTDRHMLEGILSRLQYDYAGKYFISGSYRREASSRFAPGHRWGNFGSAGFAWLINKEKFMQNVKWIDMLKFKASYGLQGNEDLGNYYVYADMYSTSYNESTGEYANQIAQKGNNELTWEKNHAMNVGFDFGFFGNRLNGTIEYFTRKTTDMLFYKDFPLSAGFGTSVQLPINVGSVINHGIEIDLDGVLVRTKDIEWSLNANLTHYKNKILSLDPQYKEEGIKYSTRILKEGGSIYESYMLKYAGVDSETGSALYYKDVIDKKDDLSKPLYNEDGTPQVDTEGKQLYEQMEYVKEVTTTTDATSATKYDCGTTLPKLYGGFGTSFRYKGLDLSVSFSYQLGGKIYDGQYQNLMWTQNNTGSTMHKDILNAWTTTNTNTSIPRWDETGWGNLAQSGCDFFLTSSNYLSLNNVQLGYTLPKEAVKKIHLSNLRIYVAGENLALISARKGLDPRITTGTGSMTTGAGLISSGYYSAMRTITAGVTVNF